MRIKSAWGRSVFSLVMLLFASLGLGLMGLYFSAGSLRTQLFLFVAKQPMLVLLNTLPYFFLAVLFWLLSDRAWVGFGVSSLVCLAYSWAEYWVLLSRSEPIYAEELLKIREAARMSGQYIHFTFRFWASLGAVVVGLAVLLWLCKPSRTRLWIRLLAAALVAAAGWTVYETVYINEPFYDSFSVMPGKNRYLDNNRYISRGGIYPFLFTTRNLRKSPPEGYTTAGAKAVLAEYQEDKIPENQRASVICVMFEAFSDLSADSPLVPELPYADYLALRDESYWGHLLANSFAGNTVNTERSVLMGSRPGLVSRVPLWSYARYFAASGYRVNGSHPGYESFYSRKTVNAALGFEDYQYLENHYQALSGTISPDAEFLPEVARICREQMGSGPVFSYNVTYQNHGPYNQETLNRFDGQEFMARGDLDSASYYIVNNYLNGIADTGAQMLQMAESFRESAEPVILVFFGDHRPWLGSQGSVYPLIGIDLDAADDSAYYNRYSVPYLIWANDAAKALCGNDFKGRGPDISPCFLMNVLFDQCGWDGPAFQKLTDRVMERTAIVSTNDKYLLDGALVALEDLPRDTRELLQKMEWAQYYLAIESGGKME